MLHSHEKVTLSHRRRSQGLQWVGAPHLLLFVSSASERFPLHAQVFEVDSTGEKHFINRINYESRTWHAGASGTIEASGIPHAHMFSGGAGSALN